MSRISLYLPLWQRRFFVPAAVLLLGGCTSQTPSEPSTNANSITSPANVAPKKEVALNNGFKLALQGYKYQFPFDHGSHPEYATEWWYYTGHLRAEDGRKFGYQLTWFRIALAPAVKRQSKWATRDIMFAHFALTDEKGQQFFFTDTIGRANVGVNGAEVDSKSPKIWMGNWKLQFTGKTGETQSIQAAGRSDAHATKGQNFQIQLEQQSLKPPTIQGEKGVSQKSAGAGRASHYYSYTRLNTKGTLTLGNEKFAVDGQSWFDHEFGSNQMSANQVGWDWFSLQLDDGRELMLYHLRLKDGGTEPYSSGTWVEKDGTTQHLKLSDFKMTKLTQWHSPQTNADYPAQWQIEVPSKGLTLKVQPVVANQELVPARTGANLAYWEGSVEASGTEKGRDVNAVGYLEMTGYSSPFGQTF